MTGEKLSKSNLSTRPVFAICDPVYTISVGRYQTACGCVDIVSHLLEQYFSREENCLLDDLIIVTLKNVIKNSLEIRNNPGNIELRAELMMASTFSLSYVLSLGKMLDWSVHKIEHALSGIYNVPHAAGLACIFPSWLIKASENEVILNKIVNLGKFLDLSSDDISNDMMRDLVVRYFKTFFDDMGLPTSLKNLLGDEPDVEKIVSFLVKVGNIGKIYIIDKPKCMEIIKISV